MSDPTPAAQAVLDAWDAKLNPDPDGLTYLTHDPEREALAAAMRAAADHIEHSWDGAECVDHLQAIADELEGSHD